MFRSTNKILGFLVTISLLFAVITQPVPACNPPIPPPPVLCTNAMSFLKVPPIPVLVIPAIPFPVPIFTLLSTVTSASPGGVCPMLSTVTGGTITITMTGPGGTFVGVGTIAPAPSGFSSQAVTVLVTFPAAAAAGFYAVTGVATAGFSANSTGPATTLSVTGDTQVCVVEESSPGSGIPALDLKLLSTPIQECPPGKQVVHIYEITNNTAFTATLQVTASSGQNARMPTSSSGICLPPEFDSSACNGDQNDDECCSTTSISNPVSGDEFPIAFIEDLDDSGKVLLPPDPLTFVQPDIFKPLILAPGETHLLKIVTRSHLQCHDGSCAENGVRVEGTLNDGNSTPVFACGGAAINVDSAFGVHIPAVSQWGLGVMVLLVLTAGTVVLGRRRQTATA